MSSNHVLAALALAAALAASCTVSRGLAELNAQPADLEYVLDALGGPLFGAPVRGEEGVRVPLRWGVPPPTRPRGGVVVHRYRVAVEGRVAFVTAEVTQGGDGALAADALELGELEPGPLEVVYLDSDGRRTALGTLAIP
jgi:hypothetical protein